MEEKDKHHYMSLGLAFGVLGGAIFKNVGMGLIIGFIVGMLIDEMKNKEQEKNISESENINEEK